MTEYLHLLHLANDTQRPLHERIGFMNVLATAEGYMDQDAHIQYMRIKEEIASKVQLLLNTAHAPRP